MKILQRYIFKELTLPFVLSFLVLNFIFMAGYLVRAANFIIGRGVPLSETFYVLILAMPEMISYTVPMSLLIAVMAVFGNLAQHNEIRAVKASGVHPMQVMLPAFIFGIVVSLAMFVFNDQVANNTAYELRKVTKKLMIKHPSALIEPGRFVKLGDNIKFFTKSMIDGQMRDIVAYENEGSDAPVRTIIAERGEVVSFPMKGEIMVKLYDGSVSDAEDQGVQAIQFKTYEFPTIGAEDIRQMRKKKRDHSLAEILVRLADPGLLTAEDVNEYWTAFNQRISFSFGSFIFVFVGIPVAIIVRRGEIVLSFALAMTAASVYYILFVGAKSIAVNGYLPPALALWLPNIILLLLGGFLLRKAIFN